MAKNTKSPAPPAKGSEAEKPASSQPREYLVFREYKAAEIGIDSAGGVEPNALVLVQIGSVDAKSAKEARRTVAKAKLEEAELKQDGGVALRAITATSAKAGRGIAKLRVEPVWED